MSLLIDTTPEFSSASALRAHYAEVRRRIMTAPAYRKLDPDPPLPAFRWTAPFIFQIHPPLIGTLMKKVFEFYDCSRDELCTKSRKRGAIIRRFVLMAIIKKFHSETSLSTIGRIFGLHHTTVLNGLQRIAPLIETITLGDDASVDDWIIAIDHGLRNGNVWETQTKLITP